jgi:hypothetical protein
MNSLSPITTNKQQHSFLPCLWTSDIGAVLGLGTRFAVEDLINPPTEIPQGMHVILVDAGTSEAAVRQAIYRIVAAGSEPEIYQSQLPLRDLVAEESLSPKELAKQFLGFAKPWESWLESRVEQLTVKAAREIAAVILNYSKDAEVELEELRMRTGVSDWKWQKILESLRCRDSKQVATKIRLEISNWLRIADPIEQEVERHRILSTYHIRGDAFKRLCEVQRADENRSSLPKRSLSLKNFLQLEDNAIDFLVDGYCLRRSSGILSGLPGSGKTIAALQLAYAVATGGKFLGEQCKQAPVLFISMDQPSNITKRYLIDMGITDLENFHLVSETQETGGWTIKDLEFLEQLLEEIKPGLVIIDSIRTTVSYPLGIEEKSEMMGHWLKEADRLVCRYATLLWIHHDNKDKEKHGVARSSGSTAIVGNVSFHWRLEKPSKDDSDPNRVLTMPKTRGFEPVIAQLKFNPETSCFDYLGLVGESEQQAQQRVTHQQKVLELLNSQPGIGFEGQEIKDYVGCGDYIYVLLARMVTRGIIGKRRSQTNHKAMVWYVNSDTLKNVSTIEQPSPPPDIEAFDRLMTETVTQQEIPSSIISPITSPITSPINQVINDCSTGVIDDENPCNNEVSLSPNTSSITQGGGGLANFDDELPETPVNSVITSQATSCPYSVGDRLEFWHDGEKRWMKGEVEAIEQEQGVFVKASIRYWAWRKSQRTAIHRTDWLR